MEYQNNPTSYENLSNPQLQENSVGNKIKNNLAEFIEFIAIMAAILIVIRFLIAEPHLVSGSSMVPNFHTGDYIITNKLLMKISQPKRGEVIVLQNPRNQDQVFIKRVIGMPDEKIKLSQGQVFINDEPLDEPYLPQGTITSGEQFLTDDEEIVVPSGQYFVLGDNRGESSDSREWGPIPAQLIVGQAYLRYWPLNKINLLQIGKASDQPTFSFTMGKKNI